jgi:hypothetical protein
VRERAAALDVGDERDPRVGQPRDAHVREVGALQVDLRRAPGALDDQQLVIAREGEQRLLDHRPQRRRPLPPRPPAQTQIRAPEYDHLAARVGLGLDQHRVHPHLRLDPGGARLQPLRHADLPTVDHARVVGHVLRLERRDGDAPARSQPRQGGDQQALARPARCALHHERPHARALGRAGTTTSSPSSSSTRIAAP